MIIDNPTSELDGIANSLLAQEKALVGISKSLKNFSGQANGYLALQQEFVVSLTDMQKLYVYINQESAQWLASTKEHIKFQEEIYPEITQVNQKYLKQIKTDINSYNKKLMQISDLQLNFEKNLVRILDVSQQEFKSSEMYQLNKELHVLLGQLQEKNIDQQNMLQKIDAFQEHIQKEQKTLNIQSNHIQETVQNIYQAHTEALTALNVKMVQLLDRQQEQDEKIQNIQNVERQMIKMQIALENILAGQTSMIIQMKKEKLKAWPKYLSFVVLGLFLIWWCF